MKLISRDKNKLLKNYIDPYIQSIINEQPEIEVVPISFLWEIRRRIGLYSVDHNQSDEYNEGFDDGVQYAQDIIEKIITECCESDEVV